MRGAKIRAVFLTALAVLPALVAAPLPAQLRLSGQVDLLAMHGADSRGLNRNFRTDSPFSQVRASVFAQRWLTEEIGVFAEGLFDPNSGPRLQGAYLVVNNVAGRDWLGVRAGMSPSIIGNFGLRSTYFNSNPVIGVPLVWQHRTTFDGSGLATAEDLVRRRGDNFISLPMLYDACWNLQWEVMGEAAGFEYSLGATSGSMSNPLQTTSVAGVQTLARLAYSPREGLQIGVSGGIGPYLGGVNRDPRTLATSYPGDPEDYDQRLIGWDAEYSAGKARFFSEGFTSSFDAPLIDEDLVMTGGYLEGRYDFLPAWFGAVRVDGMHFSEVDLLDGTRTAWDDDLVRVESSLTYRWAREVQVRLDWQHTEFMTGGEPAADLLALQLRAVF